MIQSYMSDIPEDRWNKAFGTTRVNSEKQDSHKVVESEFDSHTRYNNDGGWIEEQLDNQEQK